ncbi:hypothetical protein LRC495 [Methanocella arvoryzae MRE50]|uniref:Uncharacterized protein n=2 Tax=Methanocella TaxID=570266 RepID=Q0W852_METAR|nr:hypothetical protein LRC495 [Methanocella arvoryzae MRE50]
MEMKHMRKVMHINAKDYKNNPEHTIKHIVHSANIGRLEEGTLERVKSTDAASVVDVWHAQCGQNTCEISINKQKSEVIIITV